MISGGIVSLLVFTAASLLVIAASSLLTRKGSADQVRAGWSGVVRKFLSHLPSLGTPLLPKQEKERHRWNARLQRAGLYQPQALMLLLGSKAVLMVVGAGLGLFGFFLPVSIAFSLVFVVGGGVLGLVAPSVWLEWQAARRRTILRRSLPDLLDMLVLCLEGGLSLNGALQRVRAELPGVHPDLAAEMSIVDREMMMGLSAGEALHKLGQRADLDEVRTLATVLMQSQRYGASMARALRTFADTFRQERQQQAEERARKAAVQILFPTLLCIFPAIFVVILGPAALQIRALFANMK
jgi:tight adherence protein C